MEFKLIESKEPFCDICFLNAGNKKTACLDENHFHQNKLFFIFTLILFYENNWFHEICRWIWNINKRKKFFLTSFGLSDYPQSLYLWAFPRFFKLLKLVSQKINHSDFNSVFAIFCCYICHIFHHDFDWHKNCTQNELKTTKWKLFFDQRHIDQFLQLFLQYYFIRQL